jgi:hypothetical protein
MWTQEELDFDTELNKQAEKYLMSIRVQVSEILKLAILQSVYQSYSPNTYIRTYQLYNQIKYEVRKNGKDSVLVVFIDTSKMAYESAKDGRDVTEAVPFWVNDGHQARNYTPPAGTENNQFHRYFLRNEPRHYLELAQTLIEQQLGFKVEIIKDVPAIV